MIDSDIRSNITNNDNSNDNNKERINYSMYIYYPAGNVEENVFFKRS